MDFVGAVYLVLGCIGLIGAFWEEIDTFPKRTFMGRPHVRAPKDHP